MRTERTTAIILRRINYAEADRILTLITRDFGKITLIAKGVRKEKSKLAGGIELFSESDISFVKGKGEMGTLVSTKLVRHFGNIHTDYERMQLTATFLKRLDEVTEIDTPAEYYETASEVLLAMNTASIASELTASWGTLRLLHLLGEGINVERDMSDEQFKESGMYRFSYESGRFVSDDQGMVSPNLIKFLRFMAVASPAHTSAVKESARLAHEAYELLDTAYKYNRPGSMI